MGTRFDNIAGNLSLSQRLARDIDDGFISHAYILEGPDGCGRHTVALSVAAALSCECRGQSGAVTPCGKCKSCEKIFGSKSPDVITVGLEEDKVTIGVDAIRMVRNDMHVAPNDLPIKVYIIEDADRMTDQAQNAFLLSLEEPPSYILFFLICENSNSLLETVKSRAPALRLERLTHDEVRRYVLTHDNRAEKLLEESRDEFETLIHISAGSIGRAIDLLDNKTRRAAIDLRQTASRIVSVLASQSRSSAVEIIALMGNKRNDVCRQLFCLQEAIRDLLLLKKSESVPLCFFEDRDAAAELATHFTSHALFSLYDASVDAIDELEAGSNVRLTLMNMMLRAGML